MLVPIDIPTGVDYPLANELLGMTILAHYRSAKVNANVSTMAFLNTMEVTSNLNQSIISAMCTTGGQHAPITDARYVYCNYTIESIEKDVKCGNKVAGFGNSFYRLGIDPSWRDVANYIETRYSTEHNRIMELHNQIKSTSGKTLYPNAGMFTAVVCEICGIPIGLESMLFVVSRVPAWVSLISQPQQKGIE